MKPRFVIRGAKLLALKPWDREERDSVQCCFVCLLLSMKFAFAHSGLFFACEGGFWSHGQQGACISALAVMPIGRWLDVWGLGFFFPGALSCFCHSTTHVTRDDSLVLHLWQVQNSWYSVEAQAAAVAEVCQLVKMYWKLACRGGQKELTQSESKLLRRQELDVYASYDSCSRSFPSSLGAM